MNIKTIKESDEFWGKFRLRFYPGIEYIYRDMDFPDLSKIESKFHEDVAQTVLDLMIRYDYEERRKRASDEFFAFMKENSQSPN